MAFKVLNVNPTNESVALVLAEDGTIVEDDDYFLCLPEDTEFLILQGNKKWAPASVDGGTAWLARDSVDMDDTDGSHSPRWKVLAAQLRENLSSIILLSESDFQSLIDVETNELGKEMAMPPTKTEMLKNTLQRLLDRQEEERQCKDLLQLYLEAMRKDDIDGPQLSVFRPENGAEMKYCVVRVRGSNVRHEVSVATLQELTDKALQVLNLNATRVSVSLVLAKDGTKVDSNDFFLCLPEGTEFLALIGSKKWTRMKIDGGTIWMEPDSTEEVTSPQLPMAEMSTENYPGIILYSPSDVTDLHTNNAMTLLPDMNGNVQNVHQLPAECQEQQRTYCEQTQHTSLLSSMYRVAKEKLSPKPPRKKEVKEDLLGKIQTPNIQPK